MSLSLSLPTPQLIRRGLSLNRHLAHRMIMTVLLTALATLPFWLGSERVHSAPPAPASPPASPTPSVTIAAPAQALIGTQVKFKVTFTNGTALGYGPFLDVVLDAAGADGGNPSCVCDGITFVSAQMVGVNGGPIPLTQFSALTAACGSAPNPVTHPFSSSGVLPVTVPAGGQLITLALPFGSFQPNQPPIEVEITANISVKADAGHPLKISARGGFRFGTLTPLDDHVPDPPVFSDEVPLGTQVVNSPAWIAQATITPTVMIINKKYLGPEGENATGPNFIGFYPLRYELTVEVAPGQTITNVVLTDCLPDNMAFHQIVSVTPAATTTLPPVDIASSSGCLTVNWSSLTGSAAVIFEFFIPEKDAQGNPVLPPDCKPAISKDTLKIEADWTPVDPCDGPQQHLSQGPVTDTLMDKCIAIQKSVAMFTDTGAPGYTPGDTVKYTLNFQISDYKTFSAIDITDSLGDGQQLVGPAPTLVVSDKFGTVSGSFISGSDLISTPDGSLSCGSAGGGISLTFLVSQKMISVGSANPRLAAGILTGGYATTPSSSTPATGKIIFYSQITDQFAFTQQPGDQYVDKEDTISNCVVIGGKVMTNVNPPSLPTSTGEEGNDDSGTTISIVGDTLKKTVYAVKRANTFGIFNPVCEPVGMTGVTNCSNAPGAPQEVRPGDQVTFRLEKTIPSTDAEKLTVEDWLPLPTFTVSSTGSFANSVCGIPTPGNSCLGPGDQMHALPLAPTVSIIPATNGIKFDYGTFNDPANQPRKIDLLFTHTVSNLPFADGLFLTNEAQECETNTFGKPFCQAAVARVNVRQPRLLIQKGVIATNNGFGDFTHQGPRTANLSLAQAPAGVTFSLAGVSGTVNHAAFTSGLMDSNVSNVDANDVVTFAISIENVGGAPAYDVKIEDIIPTVSGSPSCFTIVPGTIKVQRGNGTPVSSLLYSIQPPNPGSTNTSFTITSTPGLPIPLSAYNTANAATGANIVVITFQGKLLANVKPGCCDNTAKLLHYSSTLNGPNFVAANLTPPFSDTASVCVKPKLTKTLVNTSESHTVGSNVTIGEIVRYRLAIELPETGMLPNFQVIDALPPGLKFVDPAAARIALVSNLPITRTPLINAAHNLTGNSLPSSVVLIGSAFYMPSIITGGSGCGVPITFNLGNVKNNDNDSNREWIVIEFNAQVCNVATNQNNAPLPNSFSVSVNNATIATSPTINLTVAEPNLTIAKAASPTTVAQGGTVAYTVTITNTTPTQAFDVQFSDTLPAGLNFVANSTTVTGACVPVAINTTAPAVTCGSVAGGGTVTVKYKAIANPVSCPATLTNQAAVTWTSLRGPTGTALNPTLSNPNLVLGLPGATTGERNGVTVPLSLNDYAASTSKAVTVNCPPCTPPPHLMSAWWPFDESNGATLVNDIAAVNNVGTPKPAGPIGASNAPGAVAGKVGGAMKFNSAGASTGPYIEVPDHAEIKFGSASFSIDAWVYVPQPQAIYFHPIVDKLQTNSAGTAGTGYALNLISSFTNGARLQLTTGSGGPLTNFGPNVPSVPFNTWTHVTVTVDRGTGAVRFYINGTLLPLGPPIAGGSLDNTLPLLIGESRFLGLGQQAIVIDELEMFKYVLPQIEIQKIVNAGGGGKCKCLRTDNEVISCGANGTFNYTFTVTNLSSSTVTAVNFGAGGGVTITPSSMTIPPLAPGASTNVTVAIGGPAAVSGANVCFSVGLTGPAGGCRIQHCITLPACQPASGSLTVNKIIIAQLGTVPPANAVFPVTVSCQPSGYTQTVNLSASVLAHTFTNIPLMNSCTLTESPLPAPFGNAVCAAMGWSPPTYTPYQTFPITVPSTSITITNYFGCTLSCATPPTGMVGWWPMNVQTGVVNDIAPAPGSSVNNVGAAQSYQPVNGYVGGLGAGALYFANSPAQVVSVPPQAELNFVNGDFSIDAWVSIVPGGPNYVHPIVDKLNTSSGTGFSFYVKNRRLELNLNGSTFVSNVPQMTAAASPATNSGPWYHVAVTVQRNPAKVTFYLNGGLAGSYSPSSLGPVVNALPLWIGGTRVPAGQLEIAIDEVELFNRVVTQSEFQAIFNSGAFGKCRQGIP
ncbi:MAG TPA: LamG-like jellyroll fold domain-containing protein [Pyrinomonadaceae bacterium]|nr:LamG-like jellyroll fold domain-containing protein [Pyrinomonadaceae bacterium]